MIFFVPKTFIFTLSFFEIEYNVRAVTHLRDKNKDFVVPGKENEEERYYQNQVLAHC